MPKINNNAAKFDVLKQKYEVFRNKIPETLAIQIVNFFKRNFELQGFVDNGVEKWQKVKNPRDRSRKILSKSGNLKRALKKFKATRNQIVVGVPADVKYASIHNYGGKITITPKMRRYFWAMYLETKNEFFKNMALTTKKELTIPARKFIGDSKALDKSLDRTIIKQLEIALK